MKCFEPLSSFGFNFNCLRPYTWVKFNVNRADNMIIQAIALIDTLDKAGGNTS